MAGQNLRVLVADGLPVYRHGLRKALEEAGGFDVVADASNGPDAVRAAKESAADLLFLDSALPPRSGLDVLKELALSVDGPPRSILIVPTPDTNHLLEHIRLGVRGVVERGARLDSLVKAARCVARGECWIGREAVGDLVRLLRRDAGDEGHQALGERLTPREREIAAEVAAGRCNKEIATRFALCEDTVKHHLSSIFAKVGVANRLELAVRMMDRRLAVKPRLASLLLALGPFIGA